MDYNTPGFPDFAIFQEFTQIHMEGRKLVMQSLHLSSMESSACLPDDVPVWGSCSDDSICTHIVPQKCSIETVGDNGKITIKSVYTGVAISCYFNILGMCTVCVILTYLDVLI